MALVRWNPWGELFDLHHQMDQLFQTLTTDTPTRNGSEYANLPVDIRQTESAYTIQASVPGFTPEDVEVTFEEGVLTLRGTHRSEQDSNDGSYVRRERRMTSLFRQVALPAEVRADEISATFQNGVLTITIPRAQKAQPKRIPVTASSEGGGQTVIEHGQQSSAQTTG